MPKRQVIADFVHPSEVAKRLGCHKETVYRSIRRNVIPAFALPGSRMLLVPRAWLEELATDTMAQWFEYLSSRGFQVQGGSVAETTPAGEGEKS